MTKESPAQASGLTRGHKKKARTRKKLLDTAIEILSTITPGEMTLLGLAERAEVASGTIYNYFSTKEELLDAVAIELASNFSGIIEVLNTHAKSGAERVATGFRLYVHRAKAEPHWAMAMVRLLNNNVLLDQAIANFIRGDIRLAMKEGDFTVGDVDTCLSWVLGMGQQAMLVAATQPCAPGMPEQYAEMLLRAFGVQSRKAARIATLALPDYTAAPTPNEA
ncbi:MAG: TetR/AcrR family transcriptional regulator [Limnobacter sp.]|uniref:TetR/AcrR family transcriptional regulator n=1 Tax=Limnobacter sp. TaxID=2003368 RepID=UPI003919CBEE